MRPLDRRRSSGRFLSKLTPAGKIEEVPPSKELKAGPEVRIPKTRGDKFNWVETMKKIIRLKMQAFLIRW